MNLTYRAEMTDLHRMLCCALADDPTRHAQELLPLWRKVGDDAAWTFAAEHESQGTMAIALKRALGEAVPVRWLRAGTELSSRIALYMSEIDRVAAALAREDIVLVALKNTGIARGIFPDLAACPMGDVDVLVSAANFRRAHLVMKSLGYEMGDRSPFELKDIEEAERHGGAEYTYRLSDGNVLWFELQWRPVSGRWIREDQEPPADQLIARSVALTGTAVRLLSPEDNLLQVCLHTAKHSYVREPGIRLHTDVDRIVRRCPIDWKRFCAEVDRLQVRTAVYLSLRIPVDLMQTPVPSEALVHLRPSRWKQGALLKSLWRAGYFHPEERKWSKAGYIWFNLLLYDDLGGLWRAVFPPVRWMRRRYQYRRAWTLPWWYAARIGELLFKRART